MKNKDCKSVTPDQCLIREEEILKGKMARGQDGRIVGWQEDRKVGSQALKTLSAWQCRPTKIYIAMSF